ncbi:MAG: hypothetical protein ACAH80_05645 [Alphaproteobacteria bacterium]
MASGYGKKSFGDKAKGALRRVFILSAMGGIFLGGPAYYKYGTVHEAEFKVKEVKEQYKGYDQKKGRSIYETRIITDKGLVLKNENSLFHAKFNSQDITDQLKEGRESYSYYSYYGNEDSGKKKDEPKAEDKVWRIKYYGARIDIPFIHTQQNIISVQEVTGEELAARQKAAQEARRQQQQGQQQGQQQNQQGTVVQPGQTAPSGALSGTMITFETVVDGQKIQMTVPIEAANKITVNKVTPLVPQAAPKGPGG